MFRVAVLMLVLSCSWSVAQEVVEEPPEDEEQRASDELATLANLLNKVKSETDDGEEPEDTGDPEQGDTSDPEIPTDQSSSIPEDEEDGVGSGMSSTETGGSISEDETTEVVQE